eukprot:g43716.t1
MMSSDGYHENPYGALFSLWQQYKVGVEAGKDMREPAFARRGLAISQLRSMEAKLGALAEELKEMQAARQTEEDSARRFSHKHTYHQFIMLRSAYEMLGRLVNAQLGPKNQMFPLFALLFECFDYHFEQRQYGMHGVHVDHYNVRFCPLQNVTQTSIPDPALEPGDPANSGEEQTFVLGMWYPDSADADSEAYQRALQAMYDKRTAVRQAWMDSVETLYDDDFPGQKPPDKHNEVFTEYLHKQGWLLPLPPAMPPFVQSYSNGEPCWGGPDRSASVSISCGLTNQVTKVVENGKCQYELDFETPALCHANSMYLKDLESMFQEEQRSSQEENRHDEL